MPVLKLPDLWTSAGSGERNTSAGAPYRTPSGGAYRRLHERFLRLAGGEAEAAQEAALTMLLRPGLSMLDAGCGPATVARRLLAMESKIELTLVDNDPQMLAQCRDLNVTSVHGSLSQLPFSDDNFDVAFAFWSLETLANPLEGLSELFRVTKPGGWTAVTFCARCPEIDWIDRCFQIAIRLRNSGCMLDPEEILEHLMASGTTDIRHLHCRGPARAFIRRKGHN